MFNTNARDNIEKVTHFSLGYYVQVGRKKTTHVFLNIKFNYRRSKLYHV